MTIDIYKTYRTRDGREVRIYATDGGRSKNMIHGATLEQDAGWCIAFWDRNGEWDKSGYNCKSDYELVEVKPRIKQKVWVNVYPDHCCGAYHEKRHADEMAAPHRIGCVQVEIECEEGEGLT